MIARKQDEILLAALKSWLSEKNITPLIDEGKPLTLSVLLSASLKEHAPGVTLFWLLCSKFHWKLVRLLKPWVTTEMLEAVPTEGSDRGKNILLFIIGQKQWELLDLFKSLLTPDMFSLPAFGNERADKSILWAIGTHQQWEVLFKLKEFITADVLLSSPDHGEDAGKNLLWILVFFRQWDLLFALKHLITPAMLHALPSNGKWKGHSALWLLKETKQTEGLIPVMIFINNMLASQSPALPDPVTVEKKSPLLSRRSSMGDLPRHVEPEVNESYLLQSALEREAKVFKTMVEKNNTLMQEFKVILADVLEGDDVIKTKWIAKEDELAKMFTRIKNLEAMPEVELKALETRNKDLTDEHANLSVQYEVLQADIAKIEKAEAARIKKLNKVTARARLTMEIADTLARPRSPHNSPKGSPKHSPKNSPKASPKNSPINSPKKGSPLARLQVATEISLDAPPFRLDGENLSPTIESKMTVAFKGNVQEAFALPASSSPTRFFTPSARARQAVIRHSRANELLKGILQTLVAMSHSCADASLKAKDTFVQSDEEKVRQSNIEHYSQLYYILRCFEGLKQYQNTGRHATPATSKDFSEDMRNMLIHYGAEEAKRESVSATSISLVKGLSAELKHFERTWNVSALSGKDKELLNAVLNLGESKAEKDAVLNIHETPLYQQLAAFHQTKINNNLSILQKKRSVQKLLPIIKSIFVCILKEYPICPHSIAKLSETFLHHISALKILLTICGEFYRPTHKISAMSEFLKSCHEIRNAVGHHFNVGEGVNIAEYDIPVSEIFVVCSNPLVISTREMTDVIKLTYPSSSLWAPQFEGVKQSDTTKTLKP